MFGSQNALLHPACGSEEFSVCGVQMKVHRSANAILPEVGERHGSYRYAQFHSVREPSPCCQRGSGLSESNDEAP